jgi:hypothetical protein
MRYVIYVVVISAMVVVSASVFAGVIGKTNEEVRAIAEPILDNILEGFKTDDYVKYSRDLDDTLKETIPENKFLETDRQIESFIGNYQSREYLGFLTKGQMTVVLWKGRFDRSVDDVLIKLVVSKRKDRYLVTGLWFQ